MPDVLSRAASDQQASLVARLRALCRPGVELVQPALRDDGALDVTMRLPDGREARFRFAILCDAQGETGDVLLLIEQ